MSKHYEEKLMAHLAKPRVQRKLERTKNIDKEIKKFTKRYDRKHETSFFSLLNNTRP
jgi:hypothetical protein